MKKRQILLWLLLSAALLAGIPFAIMEYQYAREKTRQVNEGVQKAEALLIETLRSDPAFRARFGEWKSLSGKGYRRHNGFISLSVEFQRTAHFERGEAQITVRISRKYDHWTIPPTLREWSFGTDLKGRPAATFSM